MVSMNFQIGKEGLTPGVIEALKLAIKNHSEIRISILKSVGRDRDLVKNMALSIEENLGMPCRYRIIGYKIILRRIKSKGK